jgi:hypothetical protein
METFLRLDSSDEQSKNPSLDDLGEAWDAVKSAVLTNGVILTQETNNLPASSV